jgi:hypothetical protein
VEEVGHEVKNDEWTLNAVSIYEFCASKQKRQSRQTKDHAKKETKWKEEVG